MAVNIGDGNNIRSSLNPIILCMKVFGVYHDNLNVKTHCHDTGHNSNSKRRKMVVVASRIYHIVVCVVLVLNTARAFWHLLVPNAEGSAGLSFRADLFSWLLQTTLANMCTLFCCWKKTHLQEFYEQWTELMKDPSVIKLGLTSCRCRKPVLIITFIGIGLVSLNISTTCYILFISNLETVQSYLRKGFVDPLPITNGTIVLGTVLLGLAAGSFTFPICFYLCATHILTVHFNRLTDVIRHHIKTKPSGLPIALKEIRLTHLRLCSMVDILNRGMRIFLATFFLTNIVGSCCIGYHLVHEASEDKSSMSFISNVFWMLAMMFHLDLVLTRLVLLHEAAHSSLDILFTVDTDDAELSEICQLQMFIAKLTSTTVGASVFNLFVITKEVLLPIVGAYATYFFILIQL